MATVDTVKAAYLAVNRTAISDAQAQAYAAAIDGGSLTLNDFIASQIAAPQGKITQAEVATYAFLTGNTPSSAQLDSLETFANSQSAFYASKGYQVNLAPFEALGAAIATDATTKTAFATKYGALSNQDFVSSIYIQVTNGTTPTFTGNPLGGETTAGDHFIAQLNYYTALYVSAGATPADAALKARGAIAGQIIAQPFIDSATGAKSTLDDQAVQFLTQAANGTAVYGAPLPPASGTAGSTFTLTTGVDAGAAFTGTANADTFNAFTNAAGTTDTLTAFDSLDGGSGIDTLQITSTLTADFVAIPANASIKNIEVINVQTASTGIVTVAADNVVGATNLNVAALTAAGGTTVTTKGNIATVSVASVAAVAITDNGIAATTTPDTLATVSLTGIGAASTVSSDALSKISLIGATNGGVVTITDTTVGHTLNVSVSGNAAGSGIVDNVATTLNIDASAKTSQTITGNLATAVKFTGAGANTTFETFATTAVIDASGSTGGVTLSNALAAGQQFTGGIGKDSIIVGATTKASTLGAGDDTLTITTGVTALGVGGKVDGGAGGNDTLQVALADAVVETTAGAGNTAFIGAVTGFETLKFSTGAAAASAVDVSLLNTGGANAIHTVEFGVANGAFATTLNNLTSGDTLQFDAGNAAGSSVVATVTNALANTSDVLNVKITGAAALDIKGISAANVETVNFLTNDTANDTVTTTPTTHLSHIANLTDAAATTITVAGDAGLTLTASSTILSSVDASGVTDGAFVYTTSALTVVSSIKGGAYNDTIDASAATKAVTIDGGAGADTLTVGNTSGNTILGGAGADVVHVGSGSNTVTLGAGADAFVLDTVNQSSAIFSTITDIAATDSITLGGTGVAFTNATGKLGAALTSGVNDYQTFLNAAASKGAGVLSWFQFGGDTYLVEDNTAAATFTGGSDSVVKLTGLVDLSNSTLVNAGHTLTIV